MESRFWHYDATFDPIALIRKYEKPDRELLPGHFTNYFGVAIATKLFPNILPLTGMRILLSLGLH
jgi:hypothetical protein